MQRAVLFMLGASVALFTGCSTPATRIQQHAELFRSLDATTQEKVRRGEIELGYTPDIVRLALGEPTERTDSATDGSREAVWTYRNFHRDRKDVIRGGYRRRVVFDPALRAETVIVEPIDDRLAARLAPQSLRLTFRDGRLAMIERMPEL